MVTGCAGFIGSHLAEACLRDGDRVIGIDALTETSDGRRKQDNLGQLSRFEGFEFHHLDLAHPGLAVMELVDGAEVVFHLAAEPGVRASWGAGFDRYVERNVTATARLLDAVRDRSCPPRVVYASSSSVYGNVGGGAADEGSPTRPFSPYGVTKLAAEQLCSAYAANFGLPVVSLRYFTVYGPRQRPEMAVQRMIVAGLTGTAFPVLGDGSHARDLTYVGDVVAASLLAAQADVPPGFVANVTGGVHATVRDLIERVGEAVGAPLELEWKAEVVGDVARTAGSAQRAREWLGWEPATALAEGLAAQIDWARQLLSEHLPAGVPAAAERVEQVGLPSIR